MNGYCELCSIVINDVELRKTFNTSHKHMEEWNYLHEYQCTKICKNCIILRRPSFRHRGHQACKPGGPGAEY